MNNIVQDMNKEGWLDYNKFVPHMGMEFYVITTEGEKRTAISDSFGIGYRFTDCTHPMQNMNLSCCRIVSWKYVVIDHMINGHYSVNHWAREKEGEAILSSIKKKNIFQKLFQIFKFKTNQ